MLPFFACLEVVLTRQTVKMTAKAMLTTRVADNSEVHLHRFYEQCLLLGWQWILFAICGSPAGKTVSSTAIPTQSELRWLQNYQQPGSTARPDGQHSQFQLEKWLQRQHAAANIKFVCNSKVDRQGWEWVDNMASRPTEADCKLRIYFTRNPTWPAVLVKSRTESEVYKRKTV